MPELPEVETVKNILKTKVLGKEITDVIVSYPNITAHPSVIEFQKKIKSQTICDIQRRGKWLLFILNDDVLLSHLRMEGKYNLKNKNEPRTKHEHVSFLFSDGTELRYHDTRKFGRMYLYSKDEVMHVEPLLSLGLEPWDENLTESYLKEKLSKKAIPIKTALLDQTIITGIGNIYDDEILFLSHIHPKIKSNALSKKQLHTIIEMTRFVLQKAIEQGGTTIRSFEASEGVHGRFQHELSIHGQSECPICHKPVVKEFIGGRGTYYCKYCQKKTYK